MNVGVLTFGGQLLFIKGSLKGAIDMAADAFRARLSNRMRKSARQMADGATGFWKHDRAALLLLIVFVVLFIYWHFHIPSPGKAVAALAVAAAVMTLRHDMSGTEKFLWMIVLFAFLYVELSAIDKDRSDQSNEQTEARRQQEEHFNEARREQDLNFAKVLTQNQREFDATVGRMQALSDISKESLDNITGGDSYTFVAAMIGSAPPFQLSVWVKGKHPVHDVSALIQQAQDTKGPDSDRRQLQSMHDIRLGAGEFLPGITPVGESIQPGRYGIIVATRNGWISEQLDIAQCSNGQWSEAIKMNSAGQKENSKWKGMPGCHKPF